jgi:MFS family permease
MRRVPPALPEFVAVFGLLLCGIRCAVTLPARFAPGTGLHPEEIGIVLATSTGMRVLAGPAIGHAADRLHRHTSILCGCALVAAVVGCGDAGFAPLSDALATTTLARASPMRGDDSIMDGCVRLDRRHPSIGTTLSGWVAANTGLASIIWTSGALLVVGP